MKGNDLDSRIKSVDNHSINSQIVNPEILALQFMINFLKLPDRPTPSTKGWIPVVVLPACARMEDLQIWTCFSALLYQKMLLMKGAWLVSCN